MSRRVAELLERIAAAAERAADAAELGARAAIEARQEVGELRNQPRSPGPEFCRRCGRPGGLICDSCAAAGN